MSEDYQYDDFDYDEEFWGEESSELEMQVAAFRDSIIRGVRAEITDELERLRKENAELREFKQSYNEQIRELNSLKSQYQDALRDAKKKAEKETFRELLAPLFQTAYGIETRVKYLLPKCGRCDDKRTIHFKSPQGKEYEEPCECSAYYYERYVKPIDVVRFGDIKYVSSGNVRYRFLYFKYQQERESLGEQEEKYILIDKLIQPGADYELCRFTDYVFVDIGDAEKFCQQINEVVKEEALKKYKSQKA